MKNSPSRPDSAPIKKAYSYGEFAERIGVSIPTARRIVARHGLRVMRMSATLVRIPIEEVERFEAESLC